MNTPRSDQVVDLAMPTPHDEHPDEQQPPVQYVVLIDSASTGGRLARLFLESRIAVAEFDAAAPEVRLMTQALASASTAGGPEWDEALAGHSARERADAEVYTLAV